MTNDQKKITKYAVIAALFALLDISGHYKSLSLGYLLSLICFIVSMFFLCRYLFYRKSYEEQGKEVLLKKTTTLFLQMSVLFIIYASYKIYETGNWRVFVFEMVIITLFYLYSCIKIKNS